MEKHIRIIKTEKAAPAGGHYVQATVFQNQLYISGQLPVKTNGEHTYRESFEVQARQALSNLLAIVEAAGSDPSCLLKVTVYLVGVVHWPAFNMIYAEMLGEVKPARAIVRSLNFTMVIWSRSMPLQSSRQPICKRLSNLPADHLARTLLTSATDTRSGIWPKCCRTKVSSSDNCSGLR
jgi:2-iminobutanoate/2-iminopropanoate deaminase